MRRNTGYLAIGLILGLAFLYGAAGEWIGVARAVGGPRIPGYVTDVRCGYNACGGDFTSDDRSIRGRHLRVSGGRETNTRVRATYVPRIANGLDGAIQSQDTVYVGHVSIDIVGDVVIGVILSLLGLVITLPYLVIGVLWLRRRRTP